MGEGGTASAAFGITALVFALLALLAVGVFIRRLFRRRPAAQAQPVEIQDLRRQLEEVQRGTALRDDLLLAEYEMKLTTWEAEGYDVREVRAVLEQHKANRSAGPAEEGRPQVPAQRRRGTGG